MTTKTYASIEDVIETFRQCLIQKDADTFLTLFHDAPVTWLGVYNDKTLQEGKTLSPDHERLWYGDRHSFIDTICSYPQIIEEKFNNIKIQNDEEIASVHFDYTFHLDGKCKNWGQEAWQLIHNGQSWRICSVIYSIYCV